MRYQLHTTTVPMSLALPFSFLPAARALLLAVTASLTLSACASFDTPTPSALYADTSMAVYDGSMTAYIVK